MVGNLLAEDLVQTSDLPQVSNKLMLYEVKFAMDENHIAKVYLTKNKTYLVTRQMYSYTLPQWICRHFMCNEILQMFMQFHHKFST